MDEIQVRRVVKQYRAYITLLWPGLEAEVANFDLQPARLGTMRHMLSMCDQVEKLLDQQHLLDLRSEEDMKMWGKINRWLGFMQGTLWSLGIHTLNELREHNIRPVS